MVSMLAAWYMEHGFDSISKNLLVVSYSNFQLLVFITVVVFLENISKWKTYPVCTSCSVFAGRQIFTPKGYHQETFWLIADPTAKAKNVEEEHRAMFRLYNYDDALCHYFLVFRKLVITCMLFMLIDHLTMLTLVSLKTCAVHAYYNHSLQNYMCNSCTSKMPLWCTTILLCTTQKSKSNSVWAKQYGILVI